MNTAATALTLALLSTLGAAFTVNTTCVDYFMQSGCVYCAKATPFLERLSENITLGMVLRTHDISHMYEARLFETAYSKMKWDGGLFIPTLIVGKTALVGYPAILNYSQGVVFSETGAQCLDPEEILSLNKVNFSSMALLIGALLALLQAISPVWITNFRNLVKFVCSHHEGGGEGEEGGVEIKMGNTKRPRKHSVAGKDRKAGAKLEEEEGENFEEISLSENEEAGNEDKQNGEMNDEDEEKEEENENENEDEMELLNDDEREGVIKYTLDSGDYVCISTYILTTFVLNAIIGSVIWVIGGSFMTNPSSSTPKYLVFAFSGIVMLVSIVQIVLSVGKVLTEMAVARTLKRIEDFGVSMMHRITSRAGKGLASFVWALISFTENLLWVLPAFMLFALANTFRFGDSTIVIVFITTAYNFVPALVLMVLLFVAAVSWKKFEGIVKLFSGRKAIYVLSFISILYIFVGVWSILNETTFFFY